MKDTHSTPATPTELFVNSLVEKGLSQSLTDIGLSEFVVDWLNKEARVPPVFGRLMVKMLARLTDKAGNAVGKSLLRILKQHFPFYKIAERKLSTLLIYIDTDLRAKEEVKAGFCRRKVSSNQPRVGEESVA